MLTVEGLTAFRQEQTVDFSDLDLFVITGATGAGKSSILDAITFALYGEVVRVKTGELRDLITHNSADLKVGLEFEVEGDRWRVGRRMKKIGPAKEEANLEVMRDGEWRVEVETAGVKAVNLRVAELLGLDFDTFTKAVLLPQGKFQDFLIGDAKTRRDILNKLLNFDRFIDAGVKAREEARSLSTNIDNLERFLDEHFGDANQELLKAAQTEARAQQERAVKLAQAVAEAAQLAGQAAAGEATGRHVEEALTAASATASGLRGVAGQIENLAPQDESTKENLADARNAAGAAGEARAKALVTVEETEKRLGTESSLAGLLASAGSLGDEKSRLLLAETQIEAATVAATAASQHAAIAETECADAEKNMHARQEAHDQCRKDREVARRRVQVADKQVRLARAAADAEEANRELAVAGQERQAAEKTRDHLNLIHRAAAIQGELHIGEACPVCQTIITALPDKDPGLERTIEAARTALAQATDRQAQAQDARSTAQSEFASCTRDLEELVNALGGSAEAISMDEADAGLTTAEANVIKAAETLEQATQTHKLTRTANEVAQRDSALAVAHVDACHREHAGIAERIERVENNLAAAFGAEIPKDIEKTIQERIAEIQANRQALSDADNALTAAALAVESAGAARHSYEIAAADVRSQVDLWRERGGYAIAAFMKCAPDESFVPMPAKQDAQTVRELVAACTSAIALAIEQATRLKTSADQAAQEARTTIVALAKSFSLEVGYSEVTAIFGVIDQASRDADRGRDNAQREAELLAKRLAERADMEATLSTSRKQHRLYDILSKELRADRFVQWVLGESMRTLAGLATAELKNITAGRYSIEAREINFVVVDHENADEKRSVATLSGGETFLASLALALALAGSVRDLAGNSAAARLEAMFIDEGFGALDAENLETAVEALEQLAQGRRMIGVISHVPMLAERITEGIAVQKVGASSTISRRAP